MSFRLIGVVAVVMTIGSMFLIRMWPASSWATMPGCWH